MLKYAGELSEKIENHVYHSLHPHIFRKFFFSQAVGVTGQEATHGLMGHGTYLPVVLAELLGL